MSDRDGKRCVVAVSALWSMEEQSWSMEVSAKDQLALVLESEKIISRTLAGSIIIINACNILTKARSGLPECNPRREMLHWVLQSVKEVMEAFAKGRMSRWIRI